MAEHGWGKSNVHEVAERRSSARQRGRVRVIVAGLLLAATMGGAFAVGGAAAPRHGVAARTFHTATFAGTAHPQVGAQGI